MAPMRSHIFDQLQRLHTQAQDHVLVRRAQPARGVLRRRVRAARSASNPNFKWHLALSEPLPEDNWTGPIGFIHNVLHDSYLKDHPAPEDIEYYMCGPGDDEQGGDRRCCSTLGVDRENIMLDDFG